ncbi:DUF4032 domain-containing protein [Micrococcales bacterium 31B]|nr:DUF4032 domain-containing protein [Micrococcales bacterium 31B]
MPSTLQISAVRPDPALLDLPWDVPLASWPEDLLAALPRGLSRHVVRFIKLNGRVLAAKEIEARLARNEYELLRVLHKLEVPGVEPFGIVSGRKDDQGHPLDDVLITRHLQFSLPYRALFSQHLRADTATRLIDALAVLIVRIHLAGFFWGDISLSNTLFRRDAGEFSAYLVDAETGEFHDALTVGQRDYDLDVARTNIIGEMMDLQAGDLIPEDVDIIDIGDRLVQRYTLLWRELTEVETFDHSERWRVAARISRLNELGFDVGELDIYTDFDGSRLNIRPKVVDAGHHSRRLLRLTGLDTEENQARRLLNDLDTYSAETDQQGEDEEFVAHEWLREVFEPVVRSVPRTLRAKLEPAEIFHEVLEHRWYESEQQGRDVSMDEAVSSYLDGVLPHKPDEKAMLETYTTDMPVLGDFDVNDADATFGEMEWDDPGDDAESDDDEADNQPTGASYFSRDSLGF